MLDLYYWCTERDNLLRSHLHYQTKEIYCKGRNSAWSL